MNVTYDAYALSVMDHSDQDFIGNLTNNTFSLFEVNRVVRHHSLNVTSLKYYFIKAFHDHLYDQHVKKKLPFITKTLRKFNNHLHQFKRRFDCLSKKNFSTKMFSVLAFGWHIMALKA